MVQQSFDRLSRGLLFAPLVLVAHFLEESSGFVPWFNAHVTRDITADLFWTVNAIALLITVLVTLVFWASRSPAAAPFIVGWLSFVMLTNAFLHIMGAIVDRGYVPGLVTAILLYLPYCGCVAGQVARTAESPREYWLRRPCSARSRWQCTATASCSSAPACSRRATPVRIILEG
jgi:uncharacterized membrane protein YoaK (UPF0700 family)